MRWRAGGPTVFDSCSACDRWPIAVVRTTRQGVVWWASCSKAALNDYSPSIVALVNDLAESLPERASPSPRPMHAGVCFSVIATTVLGVAPENRDALFKDFEIWTRALFSIPLAIPGTPFSQALSAKQRLLTRLKHLLITTDHNGGSTDRRCGISRLTGGLDENGEPLTVEDLAEQLLLLLFAGYETTASSLSCLMRALLMNPEVQFGWMRDSNHPLTPQSNS